MQHALFSSRQTGKTHAAGTAPGPLTAGRYLKLRRQAAFLSVDQVAERLAPAERDRADAAALVRMLETDGARARHDGTLAVLGRIFRFDIAVYRQLCDTPVDRHPMICRGCGCSKDDPCLAEGSAWDCCHFVSPFECTRCSDGAAQARRCAA